MSTCESTSAPVDESTNSQPEKDFHLIKWIDFNYEHLPILLQNVNGPCPLLAIFNILLLQKRVRRIVYFLLFEINLCLKKKDCHQSKYGCNNY